MKAPNLFIFFKKTLSTIQYTRHPRTKLLHCLSFNPPQNKPPLTHNPSLIHYFYLPQNCARYGVPPSKVAASNTRSASCVAKTGIDLAVFGQTVLPSLSPPSYSGWNSLSTITDPSSLSLSVSFSLYAHLPKTWRILVVNFGVFRR